VVQNVVQKRAVAQCVVQVVVENGTSVQDVLQHAHVILVDRVVQTHQRDVVAVQRIQRGFDVVQGLDVTHCDMK